MTVTSSSMLCDVCFAVCTALQRAGTIAVLMGGSAATFYAADRYQSLDADFVITMTRGLNDGVPPKTRVLKLAKGNAPD